MGANFIPKLMERYPSFVLSLFVGLIAASSVLIFRKAKARSAFAYLLGLVGLLGGVLISFVPEAAPGTAPSLPFIAMVGFFSIVAMFLPGISGAYITLIFGQYSFMLNSIAHPGQFYPFLMAFSVGGFLGLIVFAKAVRHLLKYYHSQTLIFLTGLMVGAAYGPGSTAVRSISDSSEAVISAVFFVAGIVVVFILDRITRKPTQASS